MKKNKKVEYFPSYQIKSWEAADCVNFSVALARISGWLLHVDWLSMKDGKEKEEEMKSLRVYVGDDHNNIFDVRANYKISSFNREVILPLGKDRGRNGGVATRFYSEEKLLTLPLRIKPDLKK